MLLAKAMRRSAFNRAQRALRNPSAPHPSPRSDTEEGNQTMKIRTDYWPKPIPIRRFDWTAVNDAVYDGSPGQPVGCGTTEAEAIADLQRLLREEAEYLEDLSRSDMKGNCNEDSN
jgi:hypothetical protein